MIDDDKSPAGFSLRRWSARKRAAVVEGRGETTAPAKEPAARAPPEPAAATTAPVTQKAGPGSVDAAAPPTVLPPVETLTPASDFTPFMRPDVDPALRRAALHKLFADPHFNVMDGLDVYIDDYSKPDPISPEMVRTLRHARYIFSPPATRVNEAGFVEDVPEEAPAEAPAPQAGEPGSPALEAPGSAEGNPAAGALADAGPAPATPAADAVPAAPAAAPPQRRPPPPSR